MKFSTKEIYTKAYSIPRIKFEDQQLTSFAGLVVFQKFFQDIDLWGRLKRCFQHLPKVGSYTPATIIFCLILHVLLGFRRLRDVAFYSDDPMVKRLLGLNSIPSFSTLSRGLGRMDRASLEAYEEFNRQHIVGELRQQKLRRVTLDFDGSVQSSKKAAEGMAVGFNPKKKGNRSYYPLFCVIAQTGQVLDILHREGNKHDSNGALTFIVRCIALLRHHLPGITIEVRMDGAFFNDKIVRRLEELGITFSISVPFERFSELKKHISERCRWWRLAGTRGQCQYFETSWKPRSWRRKFRFLFIRKVAAEQRKGPIQLDFFVPKDFHYDYKVIVTNKKDAPKKVVSFHEGRGQQENVFGELKSQGHLDYIPCKRWIPNSVFLLCNVVAHNLGRSLQMQTKSPSRATTQKRSPKWIFEGLATLRRQFIQRAGRLNIPKRRLTLTMSPNKAVKDALLRYLGLKQG